MRYRTSANGQFLNSCSVLILVVISLFFTKLGHAVGDNLRGKTEFAGIPAGVINDIDVKDGMVYLAAENGVFELIGADAEKLRFNTHNFLTGIIADIEIENDYLWVVEYGVGVFRLNLRTRQSEIFFSHHDWAKSAWAIKFSSTHIILSTIDDLKIIDRSSLAVTSVKQFLKSNYLNDVYSISLNEDEFVATSEKGIIFSKTDLSNLQILNVSSLFPKLSQSTFVRHIDDKLYVGGPEGLYIKGESLSFLPTEQIEGTYIRDVFQAQNGEIWVSNGRLLKLEGDQLVPPSFMNPILSSDSVRTVTKIHEGPSQSLLVSSSQLGLLTLSSEQRAVNLISKDFISFTGNINHAFEHGVNNVLSDGDNTFLLDEKNGTLHDAGNKMSAVASCLYESEIKSLDLGSINMASFCSGGLKHTAKINNEREYLYFDDGETASYFIFISGKYAERFKAPRQLKQSIVLSTGELAAYDIYDNVHFQLSKYNWRVIRAEQGNWFGIQCLLEMDLEYVVCTSGGGLRSINKNTGEIGNSNLKGVDEIRFIRGASVTSNGNLFIATNMGLFFKSPLMLEAKHLGTRYGIFDTDFEYQSFINLKTKLLVRGDKFSYLIDEKLLLSNPHELDMQSPRAVIAKVNWKDGNGEHTLFSPSLNRMEFDRTFESITFNITSNDFVDDKDQQLEFRLDETGDWVRKDSSSLSLSLSELEHGMHTLEVKVTTPDGDGRVTNFAFNIAPPIWASPLGLSLFVFTISIFIALWKWGILAQVKKQFQTTKLYKALTRYEITDGQSKFEKMLRSKELVISDITHELRTPLQIIKSTIDEVGDSPVQKVKAITSIEQNMKRIELLIDQLSEGLPIAQSKRENYRAYTVEVARMIVYSLDPLANQKRQNLEIRTRGNKELSIALLSDSLEKILTNLVQNAIKYTPEHGNIRVVVSLDSKHLKIVVSDNGPGIPKHQQASIFNRFTRGKTQENGEGIGLSIVKSLVDLNQGSITLDSEGEGSKFTVILPVDDIEFINSQSQVDLADDSQKRRKSLLIVEDDREFRTFLFDLLSPKHRCLVAKNGKQALDVLNRFMVDLIITDQIMSEMDGLALAREVRNHNVHANTPILMLTAKNDRETERLAIEEKIDYFLTKPVSNDEIKLRVEHLLSVRESQQGSEVSSDIPVFKYGCLKIPEFTNEKDMAFYLNFIAVLEKNYHEETFSRDQAAEQLLMSGRSLNRRMAELFEYNFSEFLLRYRVEKSIPLLLAGKTTLDTCLDVGFGTATYFSTSFKKVMKLPPKKYIEQYNKTAAEQC